MSRILPIIALLLWPLTAAAGPVSATRTLPAGTIIAPGDLNLGEDGQIAQAEALVGLQTRVTIYAGRPVNAVQLRPPLVMSRNQIAPLIFSQGTLSIETSGRALAEGAAGDVIPVMNLGSRQTVSAEVGADGILRISR